MRSPSAAGMVLVLALAPAAARAADEPVLDQRHGEAVEAARAGDPARALELLSALEHDHPGFRRANGDDYLTGHLAAATGDETAAAGAYRRVVADGGPLADRAACRLA